MKAAVCLALALSLHANTQSASAPALVEPTLADAQSLFYNAHYRPPPR